MNKGQNLFMDVAPIVKAVEDHPDAPTRIGHNSGATPKTLNDLLRGAETLKLKSVAQIAGYLGFEVVVKFRKRRK
jgi:hypothetical protein